MYINIFLLLFIMLVNLMITFLIPSNIEKCLKVSQNDGNIAINGVCLDIYNKRNLFYFSLFLLFLSFIYKIIYIRIFFMITTLLMFYLFYDTCNKWKFIFTIK